MRQSAPSSSDTPEKTPIRWTGVLFALASILLLVTLADFVVRRIAFGGEELNLLVTLIAPITAGLFTALYVGKRGGVHMLIGTILSVPILTAYVFTGVWQFALFAAAFGTMGATVTEMVLRRRR